MVWNRIGSHSWLAEERPVEAIGAALEELPRRQLAAAGPVRIGSLEQTGQELRGPLRLERLHPCRIPLDPRQSSLPERASDSQQQAGDQHHRSRHADLVPGDELAEAVADRVGACPHRKSVSMAAQVLRQLIDRGIAPLGLLAQRLEDDVVEITSQAPLPALRLAVRRRDPQAGTRRLRLENRAVCLGRCRSPHP